MLCEAPASPLGKGGGGGGGGVWHVSHFHVSTFRGNYLIKDL